MKKKNNIEVGFINSAKIDPFSFSGGTITSNEYWRYGSNNLWPYALAMLSREVPIHRRILNDKRNYTLGRGIVADKKEKEIQKYLSHVNNLGNNISDVLSNVIYDRYLTGNGYLEVVTNRKNTFLSLFHQDSTKCRLARDKKHIILYHDWHQYNVTESKILPIYPLFEEMEDGTLRSIIVYKDYEPMYENYGIPDYISGLNVSAIAYKTDRWNISRLDNSFQLSGTLELDADTVDEDKAREIKEKAERKFSGHPGEIMVFVKNMVEENRGTKFTPISSNNEGDWSDLHDKSTTDIIISHSWFRELSGMDYTTGFSSERILYAYEIVLNTMISGIQEKILSPIRQIINDILGYDPSSISFLNKPPLTVKPDYMKIWEARKIDGLDYDEKDPSQNIYLSQINKNGTSDNGK
jgi:hypothetical protein